jgi:hypothetical protein
MQGQMEAQRLTECGSCAASAVTLDGCEGLPWPSRATPHATGPLRP